MAPAQKPDEGNETQDFYRPTFETAKDFAMWSLNAPDSAVSIDQKIRMAQAMLTLEARQSGANKPETPAEDPATGAYAPRKVRGCGVVVGSRQ